MWSRVPGQPGVEACVCTPSVCEAEAGDSQVLVRLRLQSDSLQKGKQSNQNRKPVPGSGWSLGAVCVKGLEKTSLELCEGLLSEDCSEGRGFHVKSPRNGSQMAPQNQGPAQCMSGAQ